ncbi:aminotransferase class III-fold pyridoxal phosphate-dependent enzyme [Ulvibacter litoralis]|uniref:4-aminobutyrate aminotransferase n=1 Tax=Ulvibacter litoralis TaxID=227084 RepID=A0A1G7CKC5_9FLAO|nr:aminotransferase class III-fold pyridoxal phosphate-dependent enzyme [Ulvibacter litoralis]SDE39792.1 4-aminobutyrate aminotransferase [Ulvibacter litoralis]
MPTTISSEKASQLVKHFFEITSEASKLPGEIDQNFKITSETKAEFILKISHPDTSEAYLDFQQKIHEHLEGYEEIVKAPTYIRNRDGKATSTHTTETGKEVTVRLLTWIPGRLWSHVNPQLDPLRFSLGQQVGLLTKVLSDFNHPEAHRIFQWDIAQSLWTTKHISLFTAEETQILTHFQTKFETAQPTYTTLRKSVVHNDANDNNIIVSHDLQSPKVEAIIDYGDAVYTQIINDVAIACAYASMGKHDPLEASLAIVKGYHQSFPLQEEELNHLYIAIAMRLVISVTKSVINKVENPENEYLLISEKPAWELLKKWFQIHEDFAHFSFRNACGFPANPSEAPFKEFIKNQSFSFSELFPSEAKEEIQLLDLNIASTWIGNTTEFNNLDLFQYKITQLQKEHPTKLIAGGYCEARPLYTASSFDKEGNNGPESRSIHLGVDFWLPEQTPVHALLDGEVFTATNNAKYKEYGGLIILKHTEDNLTFYTLYGHLSVASATRYNIGDRIAKGDCIGYLGNSSENGEWVPHLHFQVMLSMLDYEFDFPGVTYPNQLDVWKSICPDPNLFFKNKDLGTQYPTADETIITFRKEHLGKTLSLSYNKPLHIVRGEGVYLIDTLGKKYLDTVNNVNHVGHQNPKVVAAGQRQMSILNTNTRYLHEEIVAYANALLKKLPKEISVLHFVNSGSEANELALRMARTITGNTDMLAIEAGYHGNTTSVMEVSSYKFDGKGGAGKPADTHILPLPDPFRGRHTGEDGGVAYARYAKKAIEHLKVVDENIAGFIGESLVSCGGQIVPPKNYFKEVYKHVREAGGICIADEVQTGFGRMGKTFWAFELFDVIPDIVTMGKPAGNGHPLAIVACTQQMADAFANEMEYFNTFGGNPVSSAIGRSVLQCIEDDNLQQNAREVGSFLKAELKALQQQFPIIGDVRGEGLFLGFELNDTSKKPLAHHATYLANRMKDLGILMSTDGPDYNVLKIKPPIVFSLENAKELIFRLKTIFAEDFMLQYHQL